MSKRTSKRTSKPTSQRASQRTSSPLHRCELFDTSCPIKCPNCGALAVVPLTPTLLAEQTDGTTHVCLPVSPFGGCNYGFAIKCRTEFVQ